MEGFYHEPVLRDEVLGLLVTNRKGIYLDCTLGGGGHFRALAGALEAEAVVIGIDRDPDAIEWNKPRKLPGGPEQIFAQSCFSQFDNVLREHGVTSLDGVLLDLGVSSFQIEKAERGFAYMRESNLDMRMNPEEGISAAELISGSSEEELESILQEYGEVQNPARMARTIKQCTSSLRTSSDLRDCLVREYGPNLKIKVLAKVFQALRIAVNDELGELRCFLEKVVAYMVSGGRLAVISYHSLEDRMVKEFIREKETGCSCPPDLPMCICNKPVLLKRVTKKAVIPGDSEVQRNPRARSARLRVAERTAEGGA